MKRKYSAPDLLVERFELTQHLTNCGITIDSQDVACVISSPNATPEMKDLALYGYFAGNGSCMREPVPGDDRYISFCYVTASGIAFGS